MNEKIGIAHERALLLHTISARKLSRDMDWKIAQHIGSFKENEKEQEAKRVRTIIDSSRTEAEMLEKLEQL